MKATTAGFGDSSDSSDNELVNGFCRHEPRGHTKEKSNHATTTCKIFVDPTKIKFRTNAKIVPAKSFHRFMKR